MRKMLNWIKGNSKKNEEGAVFILTAFFIIILLVFAAFAIDFGMIYFERNRLQGAVDAASRAASIIMANEDKYGKDVEKRKEKCVEEINYLFEANGYDLSELDYDINFEEVGEDEKKDIAVSVDARIDVDMGFAKVLNIDTLPAVSGGTAVTEVTVVEGKKTTVDVVFILDLSSSMFKYQGRYTGRFVPMVEAVNSCIDIIMKENPENRIAIVSYAGANSETGSILDLTDSPRNPYSTRGYTSFVPNYIGYKGEGINRDGSANPVYLYTKDNPSGKKYTNGGTYIQYGIVQGGRLLWDAASNDSDTNHRFPAMFILTDGEATLYNSDYCNFNPNTYLRTGSVNYQNNPEVVSYYTMRTAMHWKQMLTDKYTERNGEYTPCRVYTLGFLLDKVEGGRDQVATALLNPAYMDTPKAKGTAIDLKNYLASQGVEDYYYVDQYYDASSEGGDINTLLEEFANQVVKEAKYYNTKLTR